ncbi:MAG: GntR family transcriptional regulator [Planctomycetota bacterium]|nr:GntR family transcriptional regulator [Planctomycetota bacterium]
MTSMGLDANSPVPLYHQLGELLRRQMEAERWPAGRKLPSEHELCREHGVTRPTVRQALDGLLREGLVTKRRGLGTFVAPPKAPVGLFSLAGTTEVFTRQRLRLKTRVLKLELADRCPVFEDPLPRPWVRIERLRQINGKPALYERTWILAEAAPGLERLNLNDRSLYETLRDRFGLEAEGGMQRFGAVAADLRVARVLGVKTGAPVLRIVRKLDLTGRRGALRVELFAADGPFVLEERIPGRGDDREFGAAPYQEESA